MAYNVITTAPFGPECYYMRSTQFIVRCSPEEKAGCEEAAKRAGKTFSEWARSVLLAAAQASDPKPRWVKDDLCTTCYARGYPRPDCSRCSKFTQHAAP